MRGLWFDRLSDPKNLRDSQALSPPDTLSSDARTPDLSDRKLSALPGDFLRLVCEVGLLPASALGLSEDGQIFDSLSFHCPYWQGSLPPTEGIERGTDQGGRVIAWQEKPK
jgi:hypothetical protein